MLAVADPKLIPAKTGAGEADLQARDVHFNNYTFLKQGEKQNGYRTLLWRPGKARLRASQPQRERPVWRSLLRDVRFRRALSLAIDRSLVNQVLYFGLAIESNNTMLPQSPLFREAYRDRWARYDRKRPRSCSRRSAQAQRDGVRRLPDGRPRDHRRDRGRIHRADRRARAHPRDLARGRHQALQQALAARGVPHARLPGETVMSVWSGIENGSPDTAPTSSRPMSAAAVAEVRPVRRDRRQVGRGGRHPEVKELARLYKSWRKRRAARRERAWHAMLELHAEQQFTIGVVSGVPQPWSRARR